MYDLTRSCFLCLNQDSNNLRSVFDSDHINASINFKLKFVLPEIELFHPEHPALVCNICFLSLTSYHQFKSNCIKVNQYIKTNLLSLQKHYNGHVSQNNQPTFNRPQLNDHRNVQTSRPAVLEAQNIPHRTQLNGERDRQITEARNNFVTQNTNVSNKNRPTQHIPDRTQLNDARNIKLTDPRNNFRTQNTNVASEPPSYNRVHPNVETINSRTQISTEGSNYFRTQNTNITNNENRQTQNVPQSYNRVHPNVEINNSRTQVSSEASNHFRTQNTNNENRPSPTVPPPYYKVNSNAQNNNLRTQVSTERSNSFRTQNTTVTNANGQTQNQPPLYNRVHPSGEFNKSRTQISTEASQNTNLADDTTQNTIIHTKTSAANNNSFNRPSSEYVNTSNNKTQITTEHERNNMTTQISNLTSEIIKNVLTNSVVDASKNNIYYQNEINNLTPQNTNLTNETLRNTFTQTHVKAPNNNINHQERRNNLSTQNTNLLNENRRRNSNIQENSIQQVNANWGQNPSIHGFQNIVPQNPTPYSKNRTRHGLQEKLNARLRIQTAPRNNLDPQNTQYNNTINSEEVNQSIDRRIYQTNSAISNNEVQMNANYNSQLMRAPPPFSYAHSITQSRIETVSNVNYTPQTRINSVSNSQEINTLTNKEQYMTSNASSGLQRVLPVSQHMNATNEQTNRNSAIQKHPNNVIQINPNNTPVYEQQNSGKQVQLQTELNNIRRPSFDLSQNAKRQKILHNTEALKTIPQIDSDKDQQNDTVQTLLFSNDLESLNIKSEPTPAVKTETSNEPKNIELLFENLFEEENQNIKTEAKKKITTTTYHPETSPYDYHYKFVEMMYKNQCIKNYILNKFIDKPKPYLDDQIYTGNTLQVESTLELFLYDKEISPGENIQKLLNITSNEPKDTNNQQIKITNAQPEETQLVVTADIDTRENNRKNIEPKKDTNDQQIKPIIPLGPEQPSAKENFDYNKTLNQVLYKADIKQNTESKKDASRQQVKTSNIQPVAEQPSIKEDIDIEENFEESKYDMKFYQELLTTVNKQNTEHKKDTNDQQINTKIEAESEQPLHKDIKNFNQEELSTENVKQNTEPKESNKPQIQPVTLVKEENVPFNDIDCKLYNNIIPQTEIVTIKSEPHDFIEEIPTIDNTVPTKNEITRNVLNDDADIKKETDKFYQDLINESGTNSMTNYDSNENIADEIIDLTETTDKDGLVKCTICQMELPMRVMYFHLHLHGRLKCLLCNKRYDTNYTLTRHMENSHGMKSVYRCDICNKTFPYKKKYESHLKIHDRLQCPLCNKRYVRNTLLERHMKFAHGNKSNFRCDICNKTFAFKKIYDYHLKTHGGIEDRPHECQICHKRFIFSSGLKSHMFNHAPEENRTEQCPECDKKFFTTAHLKYHLKVHQREKRTNFDCDICGQHFTRLTNLYQHKMIHKGVKKFECKICHKKFLHNSHLKQHMPTHGGDKEFKCFKCDKSFNYKSSLEKHMKVHENIKSKRKKMETESDSDM